MCSLGMISVERSNFHRSLIINNTLTYSKFSKYGEVKICSNADSGQKHSVVLSNLLAQKISQKVETEIRLVERKKDGQTLGNEFEQACQLFLENTFLKLEHLRPGKWKVEKIGGRNQAILGGFEQYSHLHELSRLAAKHNELKNFLGDGYTVAPDIIVSRAPESDEVINQHIKIVDKYSSKQAVLREKNHGTVIQPILHASISCKYTMRSDRAQNTRTEALNLIRARKGRSPHIISLTAEPTASRIASLALGTGDIDCVYHFALTELREALLGLDASEPLELLDTMIDGKRLKDISDLPLDLAT